MEDLVLLMCCTIGWWWVMEGCPGWEDVVIAVGRGHLGNLLLGTTGEALRRRAEGT